jgi:acyl-coenzyme A synthetase/AMP-(fatty) acid ligase
MINFTGCAVPSVEIEQFLLTHETVTEVAVVGIKHEIDIDWPRDYVKLKDGKLKDCSKFASGKQIRLPNVQI